MLPSVFDSVNSLSHGKIESHSEEGDDDDDRDDDHGNHHHDPPEEEEEDEEGEEEGVVPMSPMRIEIRRQPRARDNHEMNHESNHLTAGPDTAATITTTGRSSGDDGTRNADDPPVSCIDIFTLYIHVIRSLLHSPNMFILCIHPIYSP